MSEVVKELTSSYRKLAEGGLYMPQNGIANKRNVGGPHTTVEVSAFLVACRAGANGQIPSLRSLHSARSGSRRSYSSRSLVLGGKGKTQRIRARLKV